MLRFCVGFAAALITMGLPLTGGGSTGYAPVPLPVRMEALDPMEAAPVLRGTTPDLVARWTAPIPRAPLRERTSGGRGPSGLENLAGTPREIVLTFDDGPDMRTTPPVLAELRRRNLKAIFFVAGRRLVAGGKRGRIQRELVRQMVRDGHLVGSHTIHHVHLCDRPDRIDAELDGNDRIIEDVTGIRPPLFRTPFGDRCAALDAALAQRGLVDFGWTIDPQDWRLPPPEQVVAYVKAKLARLPGKATVLLHDTRWPGVRALPAILDFIEAENRRAARGRARPIHVRDYSVLFPPRARPTTGVEPVASAILQDALILPRWALRTLEGG